MPKPRINLRLTPDMHRRLKEVAAPTGVTINQVVEQALEGFFDPLGASAHAAGVTARLIRLESQLSSLERDLVQANETLALFVQYWLTATPSEQRAYSCSWRRWLPTSRRCNLA